MKRNGYQPLTDLKGAPPTHNSNIVHLDMRENKLHEPEFESAMINSHNFIADAICSVCKKVVYRTSYFIEDRVIELCKEDLPNYCYNCGARLREIEK